MKNVINIGIWAVLILAVILLPAFSAQKQQQMPCEGITFSVPEGEEVLLVSADDLNDYLLASFDSLEGQALEEIDPDAVEECLEQNPYVLDAEAHIDLSNTLCISVQQEEPIFRVYSSEGKVRYLSRNGRIIPLKPGLPLRIPVINGYVGEVPGLGGHVDPELHPRMHQVYQLGIYIKQHEFFNLLFSQIYVDPRGELTLIPRIGMHKVLFGKMDQGFEEKMAKLQAFYEQGLVRGPWDRYSTINLKYKDQVVCTKH